MSVEDLKAKKEAEKIAEKYSGDPLKEEMSRLERIEKTSGRSGAVPNTPKGHLLDLTEVQRKHPGKRVRFVNVANKEKAQKRTEVDGYERVPESEGGKQVGNLVTMAIPRPVYEERVAKIAKMNKERMVAHNKEVERMAEGVARELRDRHGIQVDAERLVIKE